MNRAMSVLALLCAATLCHSQTQGTDMKRLIVQKAVVQRMPLYRPGTYEAICDTYAGKTATIIDGKPSTMYAAMPVLTTAQLATLPAASRQAIENVRTASTLVVQFADGTEADTGAPPVMAPNLPSYLELLPNQNIAATVNPCL